MFCGKLGTRLPGTSPPEETVETGRPEEPLERDGSPVREFAFWLRDLRHRSGLTYDQLGKKAHYATSTVQAATAGHRLPTLRVTVAVVRACGGDADQWHDYWTRIRRLLDGDIPAGVSRAVEPPWARVTAEPEASPVVTDPVVTDTGAGDGWYIESFSALLRLDAEPVEALEFRRVTATVDDLTELVTSLSVPRPPDDAGGAHDLDSELLYGGILERRGQPYDSFFQNVIVLRDAPTAAIYRGVPPAELPAPDQCGEVRVSFTGLRPGLGYGISWR